MKCVDCSHFDDLPQDEGLGLCRLNPPVPNQQQAFGRLSWLQPVVKGTDRCSQFCREAEVIEEYSTVYPFPEVPKQVAPPIGSGAPPTPHLQQFGVNSGVGTIR